MSNFIKAKLVPNSQGPSAYEPRQIILSTAVITAITLKANNEYELLLTPQAFQQLQDKYYGRNTTIKEITAIIKDEAILL